RTTTFVNSGQLTAVIPASDLVALVGTVNVTVFDPSSSTTSNAQTFSLTASANGTVTNLNDSGAGSLRGVISAVAAGGTIGFQGVGSIGLTSGTLVLSKNLQIIGPGAGSLSVNGNGAFRVFNVTGGVTVTITGIAVGNGNVA